MESLEKEIIRSLYKDVPDADFEHFVAVVDRTGLNPLGSPRQIYMVGRSQKVNRNGQEMFTTVYTVQTGIDGFRIVAARTKQHAGTDDVEYKGKKPLNGNKDAPLIAITTVWKMVGGVRCPFTASARWAEFYPDRNRFMWDKMPYHMLGKCSEALSLRRGFPQDLSGLYIAEEMDQAATDASDLASITADKKDPDIGPAQQLRARGKSDPELGFDGVFVAVCEAADALGHDRPGDIRGIGLIDDNVLRQAIEILIDPEERERIIEAMRPFDEPAEEPVTEPEQGSLV